MANQYTPDQRLVTEARLPVLAEELGIGGSGSGIEEVSGTVVLDGSGPAVREFWSVSATTFRANGVDTLISSATGTVWRRTSSGSWGYQVVPEAWTTPQGSGGTTPTTPTALAAPTLTATATSMGATLSWSAVPEATSYSVRVDGGAWQSVTGTTYTVTGQTPGSQHTVEVVATDGTATSAAASKTYTVTGTVQATVTDYFDATNGTALTAHTAGGLSWLAPSNETAVTANVGVIEGGAVVHPTGASSPYYGGKVNYTGDVRMTLRYRFTSNGSIRLHHGGNAVNVTVSKVSTTTAADVRIVQDKAPISTLTTTGAASGVVAVQMIGTAVTCYLDGVSIGTWTAGAPSATTLGFVVQGAAAVEDFKLEPVTEASAAPTIPAQSAKTAGAVLAADAFAGTEGQEVTGRSTDTTLGGGTSTWIRDTNNLAIISGNTLDRSTLTAYGAALLRIPFSDHAITAKLVKVPTSTAEVRLQARRTMIGLSEAYHMRITSTTVQPGREGSTWGTSFGAPQPGDIYTVSAKGSTITFTAKRADGTDISAPQTFTDTTRTVGTLAGIHASNGSAGWAFDDVIVKAV